MNTNHQMNYYDFSKSLSAEGVMTALMGGVNPEPEQHEYVDLGLPSGLLWATNNIQDEDGNELYFAWGETSGYTAEQVGNEEGKRQFTWGYYQWGNPDDEQNPLITDELVEDGVLKSDYDAATQNLGNGWRMPTKEDFIELTSNTTNEVTEIKGIKGLLLTSTINGNTLFLPANGMCWAYSSDVPYLIGEYGTYWSSSLQPYANNTLGYYEWFETESLGAIGEGQRYIGKCVRPVRSQSL